MNLAVRQMILLHFGIIQKRWQLEQRGKRTDVIFFSHFHLLLLFHFFYRLFEFLQICMLDVLSLFNFSILFYCSPKKDAL